MPKQLFAKGDAWTRAMTRRAVATRLERGTTHRFTPEQMVKAREQNHVARRRARQARHRREVEVLARRALLDVRGDVDAAVLRRVVDLMLTMTEEAYRRGAKAEKQRKFRAWLKTKDQPIISAQLDKAS